MKTLAIGPIQSEADFLMQAIIVEGYQGEKAQIGRLPAVHVPELSLTLACGGLGKVQFAVQTQHRLDICPDWALVVCTGAAGACQFSGIPFVEIRGITDRADSDAALDFEENLREAMANVATLLTRWLHRRVGS